MELQEQLSHWSEKSSNPAEYYCVDCGRSDETVRFVSYPFVFSLVVVTFQRAFTGIWCGRHRLIHGSLACLITSIFGWFGIPWGLLYTPAALYQLARGGIKDNEVNARILSALGQEKLTKGDRDGAIRCYEQSLRFQDQPSTRESLSTLYRYRPQGSTFELGMLWQFGIVFSIPLLLYLAGIITGLIDYGTGTLLYALFGEELPMLIFIVAWVPLILLLFTSTILFRKILEWNIRVTNITSLVLAKALVLLYTLVLVYAAASAAAFGRFIEYMLYGIQINSIPEGVSTIASIVTRGGLYFLTDAFTSGELWGVLYLIIFPAFVVLSLVVNIPLTVNAVKWQKALKEISNGQNHSENKASAGAWAAIAFLVAGFSLLFWIFPQQSYVDVLAAADHYFLGLSYMDEEKLDLAADEFETALQLRPGDLNAQLGLGYAYYYQENLIAASEIFSEGLRLHPDSPDLLEASGWAYSQLGEIETAEKNFEAVLKILPDSPGSHLGLGWIYLQRDPESSIEEFNIVLSQIPDHANAHLGLGIAFYIIRDYERALEELQIAAKDEFSRPLAKLTLGNLYLVERKYDLALDAYTEAAKIVNDYYEAYLGMAEVYIVSDDFEQAFQTLKKATALQPENPVGYVYLSGVYSWQGEYRRSLIEIEKALKFDPESKMAHAIKSSILYRMGQEEAAVAELYRARKIEAIDYQSEYILASAFSDMYRYNDAISQLEAGVQLLPGLPDVDYYTSLARYYSVSGKFARAQQSIDEAIKVDSTDPAIYIAQARLYIEQENLSTAKENFQKAIELDPNDDEAHAGLSFVYYQLGNNDAAVREAELSIQNSQYSRWGYEALAFSYYALGRVDDAMRAAKEAVRLDPTRNLAHYILGVCYMDKGMNEDAIQEFEKFLHYYYDRAYVRDYKLKTEEYLTTLNSLP